MDNSQPILVKMAVDEDKCIGSGQCEMLAEDTFLVDDDTVIAGVIGDGMLDPELAKACVDTCPTRAISIVSVDPPDESE